MIPPSSSEGCGGVEQPHSWERINALVMLIKISTLMTMLMWRMMFRDFSRDQSIVVLE